MARDWNKYFIQRFSDKSRFAVDDPNEPTSITDATGRSETTIEIQYVPHTDHRELMYVFLHNPQTPGWNRYWSESHFEPWSHAMSASEVAALVESMLGIGLQKGWAEELSYYDGEHVKSLIRWRPDRKENEATVYMEGGGCLISPFLAIRYSALFAGHRMETSTVVVEPMIRGHLPTGDVEGRPLVERKLLPMSGDVDTRWTVETSPTVGWVGVVLFIALLLMLLQWLQ